MTARDMARFGYLFLRAGTWNGRHLIPADWVTESTTSYSDTGGGGGYGYFWWVNGFPGVSVANYSARGALGKYVVVVPERDLVVVYQNHTEFPDDAAAYEPSQLQRLPTSQPSRWAACCDDFWMLRRRRASRSGLKSHSPRKSVRPPHQPEGFGSGSIPGAPRR